MQATNSSIDITSSSQQISGNISATKRYKETLDAERTIRRELKNSTAKSVEQTANQLNKISQQQKRFQRNTPTSSDQLINFIGLTKGTGSTEMKAIRNLLLRAARKSEQEIQNILQEEVIKSLGCSQEQTYKGVSPTAAADMDLLPVSEAIYVPLQSLDLITLASGLLKEDFTSTVGRILYEPTGATPNNITEFRNYGGEVPFPMNRTLYELTQTQNAFNQTYNVFFSGRSGQNLFNIKYTTVNEFGITGNYYKIALINRTGNETGVVTAFTENKIGQWIADYYSSIKLFDSADLVAQILQFISQFMNIQLPAPAGPISDQSKFYKILQRILGLCFDQKTEIDVSGISKIAELDGIDDSFFEFTEVDLRNIDLNVSNVQNGVIELVDCDNVKVPVDAQNLSDQLIEFKSQLDNLTEEEQIARMETIIDSLSQNPNWKIYIPAGFNAEAKFSEDIIRDIALGVASAVLSPKVLLPIFIMLKVVENSYNLSYNQTITTATTINQLNIQASNIITNSVEFIKKFKKFMVQVVSRIGAIFIEALFDILKKELLNIITTLVLDILKEQRKKGYKQALRLIGIAANVVKGVFDYRKCQSLMDEIKNILNLIQAPGGPAPHKRKKINLALAILSDFLPGESPQRAFLNTIKYLEEAGLPTQVLPNGQPNLMLIYNLATHRGRSDEQAENGVNDCFVPGGPPCFSLPR